MSMPNRASSSPPKPCIVCKRSTIRVLIWDMYPTRAVNLCNACFRFIRQLPPDHLDEGNL